jgi:hypothetical protein
MSFSTPPESQAIISSVKNIPIKFTTHRLGTILTIPNVGISLKSVKLDNEGVLGNMLTPGTQVKPGLDAMNLYPQARIISRILSWSIIPKSGSYSYISLNLLKATYAILAGLNVNWAKVIFDNLSKPSTKHLLHGSFVTKIFQAFKVDLLSETDVLPNTIYFDRVALNRMSLPFDPQGQESESEEEEEEEEEGEEIEEEGEEQAHVATPPLQEPLPIDPMANYNDLVTRIEQLSTNQERFSTTQDRLVASHYVMQYQLSNIRDNQNEMMRYQHEMLNRFNQQFPPPPPEED